MLSWMDCFFCLLTLVALTDFVQRKYRGSWPLISSMFIHVPHLYIAVFVSLWSCGFSKKLSFPWFLSHQVCFVEMQPWDLVFCFSSDAGLMFSTDDEKVSQHVGNMWASIFIQQLKPPKPRWLWLIGRFFDDFKNAHHDSLFFVWQEKSGLLLVIEYPTRMIFGLQTVNKLASDNTELSHIFLTYP